MIRTEYASMSDAALQSRLADTNGLDRGADAELWRRGLAARTGRRSPADRLRELERIGRHGPQSAAQRLVALEARRGPTRNPRQALLQLHAARISQGW